MFDLQGEVSTEVENLLTRQLPTRHKLQTACDTLAGTTQPGIILDSDVEAVSVPVPGFGPENVTAPMMVAAEVLEASLAASNVSATDPWFLCFTKTSDEDITAYFCKPIPEHVIELDGAANLFTLDAVPHAISVVRHLDDLDGYSDIYQEMALWAETNGFEVVGDGRDLALDDEGTVMDTQLPLRRVGEEAPNVTPRPVRA